MPYLRGEGEIILSLFPTLSHFAITHKPWVWKLVGSTHDFFNGASMLAWIHQHTFGHHPYTNIDGADPDVVTGEAVSILVQDDRKKFIIDPIP